MRFIKRYAEFAGCVKYKGEYFNEWICPNKKCGMGVAEEYICCPYCGQKIKFKEPPKVKMITIYHNGGVINEQPKIGEWIPCSERLPEENQTVIACFAHGTVTELTYYSGNFHGMYDYNTEIIVAWQQLPEPYKKEGLKCQNTH